MEENTNYIQQEEPTEAPSSSTPTEGTTTQDPKVVRENNVKEATDSINNLNNKIQTEIEAEQLYVDKTKEYQSLLNQYADEAEKAGDIEAAKKYREQSASYQGEIDKAEKEITENKKEIEDNNKITESFKDNNVTNKAIQEANKKAKQQTEDKYGEKDGKKNSEAAKTEDYNNKSDDMINKVDELYEEAASGNRLSTDELKKRNL